LQIEVQGVCVPWIVAMQQNQITFTKARVIGGAGQAGDPVFHLLDPQTFDRPTSGNPFLKSMRPLLL